MRVNIHHATFGFSESKSTLTGRVNLIVHCLVQNIHGKFDHRQIDSVSLLIILINTKRVKYIISF